MTRSWECWLTGTLILALTGCSGDDGGSTSDASATATTTTGVDTETTTSTSQSTSSGTETATDETGPLFDVGGRLDTSVPPVDECKVSDGDISGVGECDEAAPPDSFEPDIQWTFVGTDGNDRCMTPPLVANFTDDNDDGEIDLCDIPDVVVVVGPGGETGPGTIYVLDGETGSIHFQIQTVVQLGATPAIGDIDGDGLPEIVAVEPVQSSHLVAFEHDGTLKWTSPTTWPQCQTSAIALADLDNDDDVEIIGGSRVWDHMGNEIFADDFDGVYSASTAADLDGDGDLEAIFGHAAFHHDGSVYYTRPEIEAEQFAITAHPQVADLDADPQPEVLVAVEHGAWILEHDGAITVQNFAPTGEGSDWNRPANIHDFDGDGEPEFALSAIQHYGVYETDLSTLWVADIADFSGQAGGTAFDFLGAGVAQAIYADESTMYVFDDMGGVLMTTSRSSGTWIEYPTVADIDNDGSAEILVGADGGDGFALKAVRDIQDRWIPARRIWNQHTYHVTNVKEDATIPQFEPPNWVDINTFRTQAQRASGGGVCVPDPPG